MPPKEWHKAVMAMTYHFKQLLAGLLLYAATLPILLSEDGEYPMKEQMLQEMRIEVSRIAEEYGNIPFAQVYTNDWDLGMMVKKDLDKLQKTITLNDLVNERMVQVDKLNKQIDSLEELKDEVQSDIEQMQQRHDLLEQKNASLQGKSEELAKQIRTARKMQTQMQMLLNDYDVDNHGIHGKDSIKSGKPEMGASVSAIPVESNYQELYAPQSVDDKQPRQVIIDSDGDGNTRVRYKKLMKKKQ